MWRAVPWQVAQTVDCVAGSEGRLTFGTEKSKQIYQRTVGVLIEASSSSSRGPANFGRYPIFMDRVAVSHLRRGRQ